MSSKKNPAILRSVKPAAAVDATSPLWLPSLFALTLAALCFAPGIAEHAALTLSVVGASALLLVWQVALYLRARYERANGASGTRSVDVVLRSQHYIQAAVQFSVYAYWGYYWRPVYDHAWLIVAQLLFAYAFDLLLAWSRREKYVLGFGAFPIVFSTNLFLWFKDDWFYLQFVMIAVGLLGKEFVRWQRDGKETHIFNPSAFTLGLFSIILIVTQTSDLTWGQQIASTLTLAPHIYLFLFATGLVVMYFFSITLIAGVAAVTLIGLGALYTATTGVPYFLDSEIPAAVFLGLHLLVTDPSTSPRTPLGKAIFGALYGVGVFALYTLLDMLGAPTFYDKLLCVPLLNLSVKWIDGFASTIRLSTAWQKMSTQLLSANLTHMAIWVIAFASMTALGKTDGRHTGDSLPFWQRACGEHRSHACERLVKLENTYCGDNSAWACNELGVHYSQGTMVAADLKQAQAYFAKSCELRFAAACNNLLARSAVHSADPHMLDLRLLLRERGENLMQMSEHDLLVRACEHQWAFACAQAVK